MRTRLFENCEHKILNAFHKQSDMDQRYSGLAACIIYQALKDYAGRKVGSHGSDLDRNRADAIRFLQSEYFDMICQSEVTGEGWMRIVDECGLPQVSTDTILGVGRKKGWYYGAKRKETAGTAEA